MPADSLSVKRRRNLTERMTITLRLLCGVTLASAVPMVAVSVPPVYAQASGTPAVQATRMVGTVTAIDGKSLTIKTDAGVTTTVNVSDTARVLRTAPGAKTL